jgi:RimJ/RimL family protein N-acetyltransferase
VALFADYEPERGRGEPPDALTTRPATSADVPALAALRVERGDATESEATEFFTWLIAKAAGGGALLQVAAVDGAVAGYGAVDRLAWPGIPEGWYLGGLVVSPGRRRRGIGARLTRERVAWVAERASRAYYFVNERNRASIDLHAAFGFREVARDVRVPRVTFTGGVGLLFAVDLGPAVGLRDVADADLDVLFAQMQDPVAVRMAAFAPKDPADRVAFDRHWRRLRGDPGVVAKAVLCDGRVAGSVLKFVQDGRPEVTYWIGREFWGRGVATRALAALLRQVAERPVYARAAKDNLGSLRVLEKCGFRLQGEERGFANARGAEIDEVRLSLA